MKRFLILITLALTILCFVRGADSAAQMPPEPNAEFQTVDERLDWRLFTLRLGGELSVAINR